MTAAETPDANTEADARTAEVVVLGTGSPLPDPGRGGSALAVVADGSWVLVDCGRAATQRAIDAGLDLTRLAAVALTHHHSDHVSDLATLAIARWVAGGAEATTPLVVVVPDGPAARFAERCLDGFDDVAFLGQGSDGADPRPTVDVRPFSPSADREQGPQLVLSVDGWCVLAALVDHHPIEPAVGYRVERDERDEGDQQDEGDGAGLRVAVSGDTAVGEGVRSLARDVDVLVHQALLTSKVPADLLGWNAGAAAVGGLAAEVRPGALVLTHLIPAPITPRHERGYLAEVRTGGFDGPTLVARDLLRVPLPTRRRRPGASG